MLSIITHTESAVSSLAGSNVVVLCTSSKHGPVTPVLWQQNGAKLCVGAFVCLCVCVLKRKKGFAYMDRGCSCRRGHGR